MKRFIFQGIVFVTAVLVLSVWFTGAQVRTESGPSGRPVPALATVESKIAHTATGTSAWFDLEDHSAGIFILDANACTGTAPTADVKVQYSGDKSSVLFDVTGGAFTQVTTVNSIQQKTLKDLARYVRAAWTIGGTAPSCTFGVNLNALPRGV